MKFRKLVHAVAASMLAASGGAGLGAVGTAETTSIAVHPFIHEVAGLKSPPSTSYCLAHLGIHCYRPFQMVRAYDLAPLHEAGIDGRGQTILIVDSFGSPTIANDLHAFDAAFGIPDPPSFTIRHDAGAPPPFDPSNGDMVAWAEETTLDVEWSHVFAPGAKIVLEETPTDETEGVQGFPEIVGAENYAIDHGIGDVISQSFGATEETFPNAQAILNLRSSFKNAARHHVTVLASSGDTGATNFDLNFNLYPFRVNSWPSSDPLVTSMGGTQLTLDDAGKRLQPDVVWNDFAGAAGGGVSAVFDRPDFQNQVREVTGRMRGTPDISLSAAVDGGVVYYHTFLVTDALAKIGPWHIVGGTSEASPEFAGIVAMADQVAHHRLGQINDRMYHLDYGSDGLVDVTQGNNTFAGVTGFAAGPGYDLASGLGTVDAARFVFALAHESED